MHEVNLRNQIKALQERSAGLEPNLAQRLEWQAAADQLINRYIEELPQRPVYQPAGPGVSQAFAQAVAESSSMAEVLGTIKAAIAEAGLTAAGPGHLGFVPGGGLYVGAVADQFAAALNTFSADAYSSPVAATIHQQAMRWLTQMVGYGDEAWGDITSGGSHATLTAFYVARQAHGLRAKDYDKTCVYLSEHTHHCCEKALRVLFGDDLCVRKVALHEHIIDPVQLRAQIERDRAAGLKPWLIVATAGSTNLGRVDPLQELADLAQDQGLWLHVDGAYGGFFNLCAETKERFAGLARADSVVLDPHKGMFLPYGCGAVVFKDGELLRTSFGATGAYLQDRHPQQLKSPMDYSLELTRPFRSLRIWLALQMHGVEPFKEALSEKLLLAELCEQRIAAIAPLQLVSRRDLSIFAFRYAHPTQGDAKTKALLQRILAAKDVFLSSTVVDNRFVIRVAILSFRTHLATIDRLIETVTAAVADLDEGAEL